MTWKQIDTAPKDGTEVIGFCVYMDGTLGFAVVKYVDTEEGGEYTDSEYCFHPTHWMPLPEPPEDLR